MRTAELSRLKAYRQLRNVKQEEIARYLGMALTSYNHKENGKKQFTVNEAKKIADYFNTTIEDIFFNHNVNI